MVPRRGVAPPKRKQLKAKRSKKCKDDHKNLGNIKLYFSHIYNTKDMDSNEGKEGGAVGTKRKMVEGVDLRDVKKTKKPKLASMEANFNSGKTDSRILRPAVLGDLPFLGGSQEQDDRRGLDLTGFMENEGGLIGEAKD